MVRAVSRRSLAVEAQIRCQASPYGIFSAKSGTQVFLQALELSHLSIIPPIIYLSSALLNLTFWQCQ